ncbi:MFS transporter [Helicobacter sp. 16-1353]|uniref:NTP/NDP exchange transporter n=1 Tax=Helicobacter sp. 16-1353 TaxID=2004996 RepID=UPI000DCECD50|nr:MFS transporter [Helicobacter sp. 16-1353]RAX54477.1 MFS transporter [Helicobacter sp. 16-1353]
MLKLSKIFYKSLSLEEGEKKLLIYSVLFIFTLFLSYALLRPIRDALGLSGGSDELKWLFLGTFIATIFGSIIAMNISGIVKRKVYTDCIYIFFALNLIGFFVAISILKEDSAGYLNLSRIFYIWASVFNMFVISTAWSLLADIFTKDRSKRLFGIISAGASLGSVCGALAVSALNKLIGINNFLFISVLLLVLSIILKNLIIKESAQMLEGAERELQIERFNKPIGSKNPFVGFSLIIHSKYLLALLGFILLLTSVSTFLYMEQARIITATFTSRAERVAAFANIDLIVQISSFIIQIFLTSKIAQFFGLKSLLSILGFVIGVGFVVLVFTHPAFLPMVIVMSIRRVGEYALVKPGREMLFVPLDSESKYKVKNFFDTVVYRGGDALGAQVEGALAKISISLVLLVGAGISFIWGILGYFLGKNYEKGK